eukprot:6075429-Amphidinium_carterae.1
MPLRFAAVQCVQCALGRPESTSTVQAVIGLSSAESECYALTKGACVGLGPQSHLAYCKLPAEITLHSDSSSARADGCRQEHMPHPTSHPREPRRRAYDSTTRGQNQGTVQDSRTGLAEQ